ncbi:MAG: hypothetical protein KDD42_04235, partial [Bdellovibrionales bacterium]|nr:hypothetical protein [Bdellovibrionales bacterium]
MVVREDATALSNRHYASFLNFQKVCRTFFQNIENPSGLLFAWCRGVITFAPGESGSQIQMPHYS